MQWHKNHSILHKFSVTSKLLEIVFIGMGSECILESTFTHFRSLIGDTCFFFSIFCLIVGLIEFERNEQYCDIFIMKWFIQKIVHCTIELIIIIIIEIKFFILILQLFAFEVPVRHLLSSCICYMTKSRKTCFNSIFKTKHTKCN